MAKATFMMTEMKLKSQKNSLTTTKK